MNHLSKLVIPAALCSAVLVGCQQPADKPQSSSVAPITAAAPVENSNPVATVINSTYTCDNGKIIAAVYDNRQADQSKVTLTIDGKTYQLTQAVAASGARYTTEQGINPEQGLSWHTKGADAVASTITLDHTAKPEDEKTLFSCSVQAA
jgi:membrane-bound inhibitor of C-type lysozyme